MLEPEQEYMLAKRWIEEQDADAAHQMVTSHLRLAAKIAMGYRGYGLPQAEVISEANVGFMQAVKRFDPKKAFVWLPMPCGGLERVFRSIFSGVGRWLKWGQPAHKKSYFLICVKLNRGLELWMTGICIPITLQKLRET